MPYISKQERYKFYDENLGDVLMDIGTRCDTPGDLNFVFTKICHEYLKNKGERYQHYNDIIGALEGAKLELYRRKCSVYEDQKIIENGDV